MIKNWKLFLESFDDNDDDLERMKAELVKAFSPLFEMESKIRGKGFSIRSVSNLEQMANMIEVSLLNVFTDALSSREYISDEDKLEMNFKLGKFVQEGRKLMIETSFKSGIIYIFEKFVNYIKDRKREEEGEGWKKYLTQDEPKDEFENLSKSELQNLIDDALDRGDFDEVRKLSKYLENTISTSLEHLISSYEDEFEEMIENAVDILVRYLDSIYA